MWRGQRGAPHRTNDLDGAAGRRDPPRSEGRARTGTPRPPPPHDQSVAAPSRMPTDGLTTRRSATKTLHNRPFRPSHCRHPLTRDDVALDIGVFASEKSRVPRERGSVDQGRRFVSWRESKRQPGWPVGGDWTVRAARAGSNMAGGASLLKRPPRWRFRRWWPALVPTVPLGMPQRPEVVGLDREAPQPALVVMVST